MGKCDIIFKKGRKRGEEVGLTRIKTPANVVIPMG